MWTNTTKKNDSMRNVNEKKQGLVKRIISAFFRHARKSQTSSRHSSTLRTNFSIAIWSLACVFVYFLLVLIYIYVLKSGTGSNTSLFFVLLGSLIVAVLGAFYSPQLASILNSITPEGRRHKFSSDRRRIDKKNMRR